MQPGDRVQPTEAARQKRGIFLGRDPGVGVIVNEPATLEGCVMVMWQRSQWGRAEMIHACWIEPVAPGPRDPGEASGEDLSPMPKQSGDASSVGDQQDAREEMGSMSHGNG